MIDLENKRFGIFGLQGSGKTVLAKAILSTTPNHVVYDPMREYRGFRRYLPDDRHSVEELDDFVLKWVVPQKPQMVLIDEANKYVRPKPAALPAGIADLNDLSRHWGIAWGVVARRPSQFHSDVLELAHYLFVFGLHGKNDHAYLDSLVRGLGDVVGRLPAHHFAVVEQGKLLGVHTPVDTRIPGVVDWPETATRGV